MAFQVVWSQGALSDFQKIIEFIAKDSEYYACSFAQKIWNKSLSLSHFPHRGSLVKEAKPVFLRQLIVNRYRLIYEVEKDRVQILAFIHGARLLRKTWKPKRKK